MEKRHGFTAVRAYPAPCRTWQVVHTRHTGFVDSFVAVEDAAHVPDVARGVLEHAVTMAVEEAVAARWLPNDTDARADFPKTTVTIIVCLRPVRLLLMPAECWAPVSLFAQ